MAWVASVISVTKNPDGLTVTLEYQVTDGVTVVTKTEPRVSQVDSIISILSNAQAYLNSVEAQKQSIVDLNPDDFKGKTLQQLKDAKVPPPTPNQLALSAWNAARADWQKKKKIVDSGLSKTVTQADVDAAYALMKTLYKEEYGSFL